MTALTLALALAWSAAVAGAFAIRTPAARARLHDLAPADAVGPDRTGRGSAGAGPLTALGRAIRRIGRRPDDPGADRRVGTAVLLAALLTPAAPALAFLPLAWGTAVPALAARRAARIRQAGVVDQLPDVVDLLELTTEAGLPVGAALCAIAGRPGGPLGEAIAAAARHVSQGGTASGALATFADQAGPAVRPLVDALADHDRYGTPLRPALVRAGVEARLRRRRQAEEAARRLPVTLLFPLVLTTLPAFFLLAIVPLLAGSLGSLNP